jgi:hypothetical protein
LPGCLTLLPILLDLSLLIHDFLLDLLEHIVPELKDLVVDLQQEDSTTILLAIEDLIELALLCTLLVEDSVLIGNRAPLLEIQVHFCVVPGQQLIFPNDCEVVEIVPRELSEVAHSHLEVAVVLGLDSHVAVIQHFDFIIEFPAHHIVTGKGIRL